MTVIAWDGTTLAADTLMGDGCNNAHCQKIYRITGGGLFGGAGDGGYCDLVKEWLNKGAPDKGKPDSSRFDRAEFAGIVISRKSEVFALDPYLALIPIVTQHYAVGSGGPHALTLMVAVGYTAEQAVATVIEKGLANGVGGKVHALTLKGRQSRKR